MAGRVRLGVQDALWLEMDKPTNLMVVDSIWWTAKPIDWDLYRDVARERIWDRYPVFRSVAVRDHDGWWWEELPDADFEEHFEHVVLPEPGDDVALQELIASQRTVPLDRNKPLWRAFLVDGYKGGSAVLLRSHHALADGIRMVQLGMSVFDATPDGGAILAPPVQQQANNRGAPRRPDWLTLPGRATLLRSALNPVGAAHTAVARAVRSLDVVSAVPGDVDIARKLLLGTRNDNASWTGRTGTRKAVTWSDPLPLPDVKAVARANHATVNDVLVACVAGTLHSYLSKHDVLCSSVNWMIPANLRPFDATLPAELGNGFAIVQLELPTNSDDPLHVLDVVRQRMRRIKNGHEALIAFGIQAFLAGLSKSVYRAAVDLLANRAIGVLTNVPGPPFPVYIGGQKVEGMLGWAPLSGDQPMSFTIYSYDGKVFVGLACDAELVPDHEQIVDGFADAFHRLSVVTPSG